ncbi:class I SAM-dependent methyltransferase [Zhongshania sp.]|uniref:class I SAM-dependent methyltransferase n=1 Tax=Zhongshania sp. TaxID=1971902 RepID=UPI002A827417|nr:class I SAM-dependent methyltransferase [Zhongshania sp.]
MNTKAHWEAVYATMSTKSVSWFQAHASYSLHIIQQINLDKTAQIIDVGGGASTLVDSLLENNFTKVTVMDLSGAALNAAKKRLGEASKKVQWIERNIFHYLLPAQGIDLWHDRAVFHFLIEGADRRRYVEAVLDSVKLGGHVIIATFSEDGPEQCSGLPVRRYSPSTLHAELGAQFELLGHEEELHQTPIGKMQRFIYCHFKRTN